MLCCVTMEPGMSLLYSGASINVNLCSYKKKTCVCVTFTLVFNTNVIYNEAVV